MIHIRVMFVFWGGTRKSTVTSRSQGSGEEARRKAEAGAAAGASSEAKRKLELEREAARKALLGVKKKKLAMNVGCCERRNEILMGEQQTDGEVGRNKRELKVFQGLGTAENNNKGANENNKRRGWVGCFGGLEAAIL